MRTLDKLFPYRKETGGLELFAFPHVGGGSAVFNPLRAALRQRDVALCAAVFAGRERRLREEPHRSMDSLLAEFTDLAERDAYSAFQGDYALLGHCAGALVAYEIAKLLVRAPCHSPRLLVVCSCSAPPQCADTGISRLPIEQLIARTAAMGGTPGALLADRDFREVMERALRADWLVYDGYRYRPAPELPLPLLAVRGAGDASVPADELSMWGDQTSAMFLTAELDCGHWVLDEGSAELAREISAALSAIPAA
jgi:surfactin synthase thioesterase subunit